MTRVGIFAKLGQLRLGRAAAVAAILLSGPLAPSAAQAVVAPNWSALASLPRLMDEFTEWRRSEALAEFVKLRAKLAAFVATRPLSRSDDAAEGAEDVFGEASIPVTHLVIERRWRAIAPFHPAALFGEACDNDAAVCDSPLMHAWSRIRARVMSGDRSRLELMRRVNVEVNAAIRYRSDTDNYGAPDYWASPEEIVRRGSGDCKEFSITKMWMLSALGFAPESLRVVIVKDTRHGLGHAVVSVNLDGKNFILDNLTNQVRLDTAISWYQPLYSVSVTGAWIHGTRRPAQIASAQMLSGTETPGGLRAGTPGLRGTASERED